MSFEEKDRFTNCLQPGLFLGPSLTYMSANVQSIAIMTPEVKDKDSQDGQQQKAAVVATFHATRKKWSVTEIFISEISAKFAMWPAIHAETFSKLYRFKLSPRTTTIYHPTLLAVTSNFPPGLVLVIE